MQEDVSKQGGRHRISRFFHARNDKETIAGWRLDLNQILHVFNVRSVCSCFTVTDRLLLRPSWP